MEIKINILKWWRNRKAAKRKAESEERRRRSTIYRGQALKVEGNQPWRNS